MDFWIGDQVWIKSKSRAGVFEGEAGNQSAKVRINKDIFVIPLNDLMLHEDKTDSSLEVLEETTPLISKASNTIDLHADKLFKHLPESSRVLRRQIEACRTFIQNAIEHGQKRIVIIHGKGDGTLAREVELLLDGFSEVQFVFPVPSGGAKEVWLKTM